jgi:hypothetical protein
VNDKLVRLSWIGTALFAVTSAAAVAVEGLRPVAVAVSLLLFTAGIVAFLVALTRAAGRSRTEVLTVPEIFFLQRVAPPAVRRHLMGSWAAEIVVAFAAAFARPFTSLAFCVLAPMFGIGLAGVWGATKGAFAARG